MPPLIKSICEIELPTGESVAVQRRRFGGGDGPRVAIVAGLRGDTPEGVRVCHTVGRYLEERAERISGTVDLYPCLNPLAAHQGSRHWPGFDLDLNRRFPGNAEGHAPDRVAAALVADLQGADQVVELRGAHPAFRQATQARVRGDAPLAAERAAVCNVRVLWRRSRDHDPGSLAAAVPGLIGLEGGAGNRLTDGVGLELSDGVMNLLSVMGVVPEADLPFHWAAIQRPSTVQDADLLEVRTQRGGLFLPAFTLWAEVEEGAVLGEVVDPVSGEVREVLHAGATGRVLAQREQPIVYPGNLTVRLVRA